MRSARSSTYSAGVLSCSQAAAVLQHLVNFEVQRHIVVAVVDVNCMNCIITMLLVMLVPVVVLLELVITNQCVCVSLHGACFTLRYTTDSTG
jgi:hypothetical protein